MTAGKVADIKRALRPAACAPCPDGRTESSGSAKSLLSQALIVLAYRCASAEKVIAVGTRRTVDPCV